MERLPIYSTFPPHNQSIWNGLGSYTHTPCINNTMTMIAVIAVELKIQYSSFNTLSLKQSHCKSHTKNLLGGDATDVEPQNRKYGWCCLLHFFTKNYQMNAQWRFTDEEVLGCQYYWFAKICQKRREVLYPDRFYLARKR